MACWCDGKCPHIGAPKKYAEQRMPARAHAALRRALIVAPLCVEANLAMASVLVQGNHAAQAAVHLDRAEQRGVSARSQFERAVMLRAQTKLREAITVFYEALQLDPGNPNITAGLVDALEAAGEVAAAKKLVTTARETFPDNHLIRRAAAIVAAAEKDFAGAISILHTQKDPAAAEPIEWLDLGRYHEKIGDYETAWSCWMRGKAILREKHGHRYNVEKFNAIFAALAQAAIAPRPELAKAALPLSAAPSPLFITGFPRSGTTMIENVFSAHSAIVAGDELMGLTDVIEAMPRWLNVRVPYPRAMLATGFGENSAIIDGLRDFYMRAAKERIGFAPTEPHVKRPKKITASNKMAWPLYFTDKMPLNEMHIPLIRLLFPAARIFHVRRHPLDVMVSCMSHWLVHGGFYASSLESCAAHYAAIDSLLEHYRRQGRAGVFTIRYEDFIKDQARCTDAMLHHAGLAMEPGCLDFHLNPRHSRTISYAQVKEPLHDRSVGRWKNYREQLEPAVKILRPIIEREGYEI